MTPTSTPASSQARDLTSLFSPSSIAIVGASNNPAKYGNWLAARVLRDRALRQPYLINKTSPHVLGEPTAPSLTDLARPVDLAVIAVPAAAFFSAVEDAVTAQVKTIVAVTSGLGETGGQALRDQTALVARLRQAGINLLGPNCLGVLDNTTGLDATVNEFPPGTVSVVSQSGNLAIDIAEHLADVGLGVARFASLGNCADLDVSDLVESCIDHPGTAAIAVYCEGFQDGRKFARAAARAAAVGKPVALLSVGHGAASARAATTHTGSMVTPTIVLEAVAEAVGAELVRTPLEMANLLQAILRTRPPTGNRVAVLSDGGGHASVASDTLENAGFTVDPFSRDLAAELAAELPPTATVTNPIDVAGGGEQDIRCFSRVARHLADTSEVDATLMTGFFGGYGDYDEAVRPREEQVSQDLAALVNASGASFVAQTMSFDSPAAKALQHGGVAVYRNVEDATWALQRVTRRAAKKPSSLPVIPRRRPAITESGYWAARRQLAEGGLPFVPAAEVSTHAELHEAATRLGFPLVLKALGDDHKSDRGGVILGIDSRSGLDAAWQNIQQRLAPPTCSVEQQADLTDAVELIIGVRHDPAFGPIVLAGIGGIYAELLKDTHCALGPVTPQQSRNLLRSLRGARLLTGYRGRPALNIDAAADLVAALSTFAAEHPEIAEVECNPIAVTPQTAIALDARISLTNGTP